MSSTIENTKDGPGADYPQSSCSAGWKEHAEMLAILLADAAGYLSSVRTDRTLARDGEVFALQTLDWAEGAKEYAEKANSALDIHDERIMQNTLISESQHKQDHAKS